MYMNTGRDLCQHDDATRDVICCPSAPLLVAHKVDCRNAVSINRISSAIYKTFVPFQLHIRQQLLTIEQYHLHSLRIYFQQLRTSWIPPALPDRHTTLQRRLTSVFAHSTWNAPHLPHSVSHLPATSTLNETCHTSRIVNTSASRSTVKQCSCSGISPENGRTFASRPKLLFKLSP